MITEDEGATRSVVVTGCGTGIGRSIVARLAHQKWQVVAVESDPDRASELAARHDRHVHVLHGDVTEHETLRRAAANARELGPLGGWVNNAAINISGPLHLVSPKDIDHVLRTDLWAYIVGCREAILGFLQQRTAGAIVNVSSIHARSAFPRYALYDTAKGGVEALTRYVAVEYGPAGIRCNAVAPGAIRTPRLQARIDESDDPGRAERETADLHPLGRIGEMTEVAAVVTFLLSDEASFVSGATVPVDGAAAARCYPYSTDHRLSSSATKPTGTQEASRP